MATTAAVSCSITGCVARANRRLLTARARASAALSFLPVARLTRFLIAFLPTIAERFLRVPPQKNVNSPASPLAKCAPR